MKSTNIKRGRPKKEKTEDFSEVVKEALKGSHDAERKEKLATPPKSDPTAFVNKIYHYKDGTICRVYYSSCKDKPIDIKFIS